AGLPAGVAADGAVADGRDVVPRGAALDLDGRGPGQPVGGAPLQAPRQAARVGADAAARRVAGDAAVVREDEVRADDVRVVAVDGAADRVAAADRADAAAGLVVGERDAVQRQAGDVAQGERGPGPGPADARDLARLGGRQLRGVE